jgi:hypothetical protein
MELLIIISAGILLSVAAGFYAVRLNRSGSLARRTIPDRTDFGRRALRGAS